MPDLFEWILWRAINELRVYEISSGSLAQSIFDITNVLFHLNFFHKN